MATDRWSICFWPPMNESVDAVEAACQTALNAGLRSADAVLNILSRQNEPDNLPDCVAIPPHLAIAIGANMIKARHRVRFFSAVDLVNRPEADHRHYTETGVWMDPDMNKYDLNHWVMKHPKMNHDEFMKAYEAMWHAYYTPEHIETVMRRAIATGC